MSSATTSTTGPVGPPHVHHMDAPTAYHAAKLGMWLFLATEILLFGGLFAAFAIYHHTYPEAFHHGSRELNWQLGGINTVVLIFSSFLAALAVDAAQHGKNAKVTKLLCGTIACGAIFLVIKYFEYASKIEHGYFPGIVGPHGVDASFNGKEFNEKFRSFFRLYYCMTGLHALHVIFGMAILGWVVSKSSKNRFSTNYYTPVEVGALYWHLVDLIWIYLFPLLYLIS